MKIKLLHWLAKIMGVSVRIDGLPYGKTVDTSGSESNC
jgi:hypothetical protein